MYKKLSLLIALALTVTSLASCNKASGDRSDDLRVEREGGDYKHEYGLEIETETHPIVTTETSEEPPVTTTESTTTSTNNTSTVNITPGKTMDVGEFCYLMVNYLGSHYNDATSALNSYSSTPLEEYYTGDYEDEKWVMYNCAIAAGNVVFDIFDVSYYTTNDSVYELSFSTTITDGDAKKTFDYLVLQITAVYGEPYSTDDEDSYDLVLFELENDVTISVNAFYADSISIIYVTFSKY
ncbi:MAG: hypothetical protein IKS75_03115 [Clostridiales bacterium]|nr:hypothetical protein [Clostridiales bacterium]